MKTLNTLVIKAVGWVLWGLFFFICVGVGSAWGAIGFIVGFCVFLGCVSCAGRGSDSPISYFHLRGNSLSEVNSVEITLPNADSGFQWGRLRLPSKLATQHIFVAGTTGSGKTVLIRLLMQSVFPLIGRGQHGGMRALVYDGKKDLLGVLYGLNIPRGRVINFDPFDQRSVQWNLARDVEDPASAREMAAILFPKEDGEHNPFFPLSVQLLAAAVMITMLERGCRHWTLGDLVHILESPERLQEVLSQTERGCTTLEQIFNQGETLSNIIATIATKVQDYAVVAALWERAETSYSLSEWLQEEKIIVLRSHHVASKAVDAINRAMMHRASQLLLNANTGRAWVVLDELATAGKLEGLPGLMDKGRSRGISVILGFQNISKLKEVYGDNGAQSLVALCSTKALLRFEDDNNAQWAASFFGKEEVRVVSKSHGSSSSKDGTTYSTNVQYEDKEREVVIPSEFLSLPHTNEYNGLTGYYATSLTGAYRDTLPGEWLFNDRTLCPEKTEENFLPRPGTHQWLERSADHLKRLFNSKTTSDRKPSSSTDEPKGRSRREKQFRDLQGAMSSAARPDEARTRRERQFKDLQEAHSRSTAAPKTSNGSHARNPQESGVGLNDLPTREEVEVWDFSQDSQKAPEIWDFSQRP